MPRTVNIALVGDYSADVVAHQAIPEALRLASLACGVAHRAKWVGTAQWQEHTAEHFDGVWCVPASPYRSETGAIAAIETARHTDLPFLGTCGGYQHAVLAFARNQLHLAAGNTEVDAQCDEPLIQALSCALHGVDDDIRLQPGSQLARIYGTCSVREQYQCGFGVNRQYLPRFVGSAMQFVGFDQGDDPRAFELQDHPFFIGTAWQPERRALQGRSHPLIVAFLDAMAKCQA